MSIFEAYIESSCFRKIYVTWTRKRGAISYPPVRNSHDKSRMSRVEVLFPCARREHGGCSWKTSNVICRLLSLFFAIWLKAVVSWSTNSCCSSRMGYFCFVAYFSFMKRLYQSHVFLQARETKIFLSILSQSFSFSYLAMLGFETCIIKEDRAWFFISFERSYLNKAVKLHEKNLSPPS